MASIEAKGLVYPVQKHWIHVKRFRELSKVRANMKTRDVIPFKRFQIEAAALRSN